MEKDYYKYSIDVQENFKNMTLKLKPNQKLIDVLVDNNLLGTYEIPDFFKVLDVIKKANIHQIQEEITTKKKSKKVKISLEEEHELARLKKEKEEEEAAKQLKQFIYSRYEEVI